MKYLYLISFLTLLCAIGANPAMAETYNSNEYIRYFDDQAKHKNTPDWELLPYLKSGISPPADRKSTLGKDTRSTKDTKAMEVFYPNSQIPSAKTDTAQDDFESNLLLTPSNIWSKTISYVKKILSAPSILHTWFPVIFNAGVTITSNSTTDANVTIPPKTSLSPKTGRLSQFASPAYSLKIPKQVKDVYTWDVSWNPSNYPNSYLQCTTYVSMIYNLNGVNVKNILVGDARQWVNLTKNVYVFKSGAAISSPKVLDTVIWASNEDNHAGVITQIQGTKVTVVNANSTQAEYVFYLNFNYQSNTYELKDAFGRTSDKAWVPSHWLRIASVTSATTENASVTNATTRNASVTDASTTK